jgi:hypothetical protein
MPPRRGNKDTALFYGASLPPCILIIAQAQAVSTEFDLIARVLPGRTCGMCKNKFNAEDKKHHGLMYDALKKGVAFGALHCPNDTSYIQTIYHRSWCAVSHDGKGFFWSHTCNCSQEGSQPRRKPVPCGWHKTTQW